MAENRITKDTVPENFTLSLVLVDAVPVIFFGLSMCLVGYLFSSPLFMLSAFLCLFAGAAKVLWKLIVVKQKKNVWWLFLQMRILMPIGMLGVLGSAAINHDRISLPGIHAALFTMPSAVFFGLGILGMGLMMIFAFRLDSSDVKSNWIEQITNGIAQICIFLGLLLTVLK